MSKKGWSPRPNERELPHQTPPKVLLLADSRGRNLDVNLRDLLGDTFTLMFYPGASIMDTIRRSESAIRKYPWSQIYCLAGICDLTVKDTTSQIVSIRSCDSDQLVKDYCETLHEAYTKIMQISPPNSKPRCIFCPVTGLSFSTYNRRHHPDDIMSQVTLNETIVKLNSEIIGLNNLHSNHTPWTSRTVHRRHRQSLTNLYDKLATDGCHLRPPLRQHWADSLHEAIMKNSQ